MLVRNMLIVKVPSRDLLVKSQQWKHQNNVRNLCLDKFATIN